MKFNCKSFVLERLGTSFINRGESRENDLKQKNRQFYSQRFWHQVRKWMKRWQGEKNHKKKDRQKIDRKMKGKEAKKKRKTQQEKGSTLYTLNDKWNVENVDDWNTKRERKKECRWGKHLKERERWGEGREAFIPNWMNHRFSPNPIFAPFLTLNRSESQL